MAKVKETKVALKGEKAKKAPKASETARKLPKQSEEIVVESDSDESASDSSSGHSSGSESDAEKRKNTKKPKLAKAKETEPASPAVADDSSDDSSSDDDSEEGKKAKAKKAPAAVETNGTAHKTESSSEKSSSDSDDESDSDEESEKEKDVEAPKTAGQPNVPETTATAYIPPQPFVPPPGYKQLNTKTVKASTLNSLLDPKSLSSKQIWHITAPSSVPLSDIKSISLAAIQSHQTVLSHKGTDYNFAEASTSNARVLLPSSKSDGYAPVEIPVAKVLNLQQTINLPNVSSRQTNPITGSDAAAKVSQPPVRTARPQPKVLKMRCKPPGFGEDEPGTIGTSDEESDSDVEMAEAPAKGFKQPSGESKESRSKRKRDEKEAAEASPRMDKKRRKAVEQAKKAEEDLVAGTRDEAPETTEEKERKKREKKDKKKKEKSK